MRREEGREGDKLLSNEDWEKPNIYLLSRVLIYGL